MQVNVATASGKKGWCRPLSEAKTFNYTVTDTSIVV
jgi:hypothetical protein